MLLRIGKDFLRDSIALQNTMYKWKDLYHGEPNREVVGGYAKNPARFFLDPGLLVAARTVCIFGVFTLGQSFLMAF